MTVSEKPVSEKVGDIATAAQTPSWRIVAEREVTTTLKQKSFIITMVVSVLGIVGIIIGVSMFGGKPADYTVAVTDEASGQIVSAASTALDAQDDGAKITAEMVGSTDEAESLVEDETADAALLPTADGYELVGNQEVETDLAGVLAVAAQSATLESNAAEQNVDLAQLQSGVTVDERSLDPNTESSGARSLIAFIMSLLFYGTAVTYGMTIAQSVVQEKESRIVEILASAVPLRSLLWGKIIGNSILAFLQIAAIVVASVVALQFSDMGDVAEIVRDVSGWYVLFFVLGFFAMAGVWAVAGSLASRQQDLGSTTLAGNMLLFAPYMVAVTAGEGVKTVVSMLPISSAMVMPARMAEGSVPMWQLGVAVAANLAAIAATVWIGARIYERTLMRTERRISFREALSLGA